MKKNIAVISVRFNSKRLPGKALKKYKNKNSIDRIFESLRKLYADTEFPLGIAPS